MSEEVYFSLQESESTVAMMASHIFAGFVTAGQLTDSNEDALINRSLSIAIKMAQKADKVIDSDNENKH